MRVRGTAGEFGRWVRPVRQAEGFGRYVGTVSPAGEYRDFYPIAFGPSAQPECCAKDTPRLGGALAAVETGPKVGRV